MKKKKAAVFAALMLAAVTATACGSSDDTTKDQTAATETVSEAPDTADSATETPDTANEASEAPADTENKTEDAADAAQDAEDVTQDIMECLTESYVVYYEPQDFEGSENGDDSVISYIGESTKAVGSNTITISEKKDTTYDVAMADILSQNNADKDALSESAFGAKGAQAYSYTTGVVESEDGETKTCDTYYALPHGNDVILITVSRQLGTDDNAEMEIDDKIAGVLDTFELQN